MGSLDSASQELRDLIDSGAEQTVLNFSRGWGKAQVMDSLYPRLRMAWDHSAHPQEKTVGERRLQKLAPAFGLQAEDVLAGKGDSRAKLQRALLDLLDEVGQDQRLVEAQQRYDEAVRSFEERGNSVVVAAANSGQVLETMALDAPTPHLAEDFFSNRLANEQVTTVGATRAFGDREEVAPYTNPDPGIDIYANGQLGSALGTSFATPRVGSARPWPSFTKRTRTRAAMK